MDLNKELYLSFSNFNYRKLISKLRISDHNLEIEAGRYKKVPRHLRLCNFCTENVIDNEFQFLLKCSKNAIYRKQFLEEFSVQSEHFNNNFENILVKILNPHNPQQGQICRLLYKNSL